MLVTATPRTATVITADDLAAAAGLTDGTDGPGFQFRDPYGVTYTGTPAHLVLAALARPDVTPGLYPGDLNTRLRVRDTARLLAEWFTCPHVTAAHAVAFAALTPRRVCELVTHVANHGNRDTLSHVGPESLAAYTTYLLGPGADDPAQPFPCLIDQPYRSLGRGYGADHRPPLDITATAPDGGDEVKLHLDIKAHESISWDFIAAVPVPTDELNGLLMDPDYYYGLGGWLEDNLELIDAHLDYSNSTPDQGIATTVGLAGPDIPVTYPGIDEPPPPAPRADVALFFVGPDAATATASTPFLDCGQATEAAAAAGHRVFTAEAEITAASLHSA